MLGFQWLSFRVRGWVVLCFRPGLGDDVLWYLPCSSVCGLHCTDPTNARQSQWETVLSCAGGQVFLVRLGGDLSAMCAVPVAAVCNVKVLLAPDAMVTGVLVLGHETVCFVSLGPSALVLLLRIFFGRTSRHPGGRVWGWRSRSPLRGYCFGAVVPWFLATFYRLCGWHSGSWVTRSCSPGHVTASDLVPGPRAMLPRPSPSHGLGRLGIRVCLHTFGLLSLFPGNIGLHFLGISRSFFQ